MRQNSRRHLLYTYISCILDSYDAVHVEQTYVGKCALSHTYIHVWWGGVVVLAAMHNKYWATCLSTTKRVVWIYAIRNTDTSYTYAAHVCIVEVEWDQNLCWRPRCAHIHRIYIMKIQQKPLLFTAHTHREDHENHKIEYMRCFPLYRVVYQPKSRSS